MEEKYYLKNDFVKAVYIHEFGIFEKKNLQILFSKIYDTLEKCLSKEIDNNLKSEYEKILLKFFPSGKKSDPLDTTKRKLLNTHQTNSGLTRTEAEYITKAYGWGFYNATQTSKPEQLSFTDKKKKNEASKDSWTGHDVKVYLKSYGEMELELFRMISNTSKELYFFFCHEEMKILSNYTLSIIGIKLKDKNIKINIIFYDTGEANRQADYQKLRIFKHLGCNIASLNFTKRKPPFVGVITDPLFLDYSKILSVCKLPLF